MSAPAVLILYIANDIADILKHNLSNGKSPTNAWRSYEGYGSSVSKSMIEESISEMDGAYLLWMTSASHS